MRSSTSNSNSSSDSNFRAISRPGGGGILRTDAAKILLLALLLFVVYSLALEKTNQSHIAYQNQRVSNYATAEKFIYKKNKKPRAIIVGSSLGTRLNLSVIKNGVETLAFGGGSALTGLELIRRSERLPGVIFVETNVLSRRRDKKMLERLFTPFVWRVKGRLKALRYTYQPMNFLLRASRAVLERYDRRRHRRILEKRKRLGEKTLNPPPPEIPPFQLKRLRQRNSKVKELALKRNMKLFKKNIAFFRRKGVKVVFFQMPVHPIVLSSERYRAYKTALLEAFPNANFHWVSPEENKKFRTSDGVHLDPPSALKYSRKFAKIVSEYTGEQPPENGRR